MKALTLDTPVYSIVKDRGTEEERYPEKTIGDLKVGDSIIGDDGKPTKVIHLNPIIIEDVYEVEFDDGEIIQCNGEHLWKVSNDSSTNYINYQLKETYFLYNIYKKNKDKEVKDFWKVPVCSNFCEDKKEKINGKAIVDVRRTNIKKAMRCITVDNDSGCFLCGKNYTVTHNSFMSAPFIMAKSLLFPSYKTYIMGPTGQQAQETFTKMENLAKNNIASVIGITSVFLDETLRMNSKADPFTHDKSGYHVELYNGSEINTLNSVAKNIVGIRSNLNKRKCSRSKKLVRKNIPLIAGSS